MVEVLQFTANISCKRLFNTKLLQSNKSDLMLISDLSFLSGFDELEDRA
jgi:hypothetical protein